MTPALAAIARDALAAAAATAALAAPVDPGGAEVAGWLAAGAALAGAVASGRTLRAWLAGRLGEAEGRDLASAVLDAGRSALRSTTAEVLRSPGDADGWRRAVTPIVGATHAGAALATLGRPEMAPAERPALAAAMGAQLGLLARFAGQVASGARSLGGAVLARIALYAASAWATAQEARRRAARLAGSRLERRILEGWAAHCRDCPPLASAGWVPIGSLPAIGTTSCRAHCRCYFRFQ